MQLDDNDISDEINYNGEQMDINYRAALEITSLGELAILYPNVKPFDISIFQDYLPVISSSPTNTCINNVDMQYKIAVENLERRAQNDPNSVIEVCSQWSCTLL